MKCYLKLLTYAVNFFLLLSLGFGAVLTEKDIKRIAIKELRSRFGSGVKLKSVSLYLRAPVHYRKIEDILLRGVEGQPRASLHIYLRTQGGMKRISAVLNLLWRCSLLVAKRRIDRGERIYPWKLVRKDSFRDRCPKQGIKDSQNLINYVAIRPIEQGEPVRISYLKKEHLVKRGESVKLILRRGSIEIEVLGESQDNGFLGDRVRVKILHTSRILRGSVIGENMVLVR